MLTNDYPNNKQKANILVIGNSGAGKSTLINSILGEERAETSSGEAVTKQLEIYENPNLPFRVIDTVGFEFDIIKQWKAIHAVKKWSKDSILKSNVDKQIDIIWYCVEATSKKLFAKNIEMLTKAASTWKQVPLIVVLTKSYSEVENAENIKMIQDGFSKYGRKVNLKRVIPVVAQPYYVSEDVVVSPSGLTELVEETNNWIPEGMRLSREAVDGFVLKQKRYEANALVAGAVTAAGAIAAVPKIPFTDATLLTTLELGMVTAISRLYGVSKIKKGDSARKLISTIVEVGTVSTVAKGLVEVLKTINPIVNIANIIVACTIVAAVGEATIGVMEAVYTGKVDIDDLDWIRRFTESELKRTKAGKIKQILSELLKKSKVDLKELPKIIAGLFIRK